MPNQEIGVKSIWDTKQFSRGLNTYLKGLNNAIAATNNAVAAINNFGATTNTVFATIATHSKTLLSALQAITNAAKAASAASAKATGRGTPKVQVINNPAAGATVQQINAATSATRNLNAQVKQTTGSLQTLNTKAIAVGTALGTVAGNAIVAFGRSLGAFGGKVLEIVTFFERLDLSIGFFAARSFQAEDASLSFTEALALGAKEAQGLSIWLQRLAVASPFTTRDVGVLFRTAQAYGLTRKEAELLTPLLLDFAAAAGLDEEILQRLALAMGQVRARGKLTGEEVRQLGNSGIPIRDILVKSLGIANEEFDKLLEEGAFTSDVVIPKIIEALKDFEGAGERVAFGTIGGIISAFQEIREIGIAKFFTGILAPLKQSFQELFAVVNQPQTLAFIQVLGEEIGVKLKNAVFGLVEGIQGLIGAWRALDPAVQQQIIVFAGATAGALALIAAFGLLTVAMGLLLNPVSLIAVTIGFLISEWTSGFAVLRTLTSNVVRGIGRALQTLGRNLSQSVLYFLDFVNGASEAITGLEREFLEFGRNIVSSLAQGISAGSSILVSALSGIGNLLTFWLAPGSPPRIAPDIDDWGKATMEEYIKAFGNANVKKSLGNGLSIVSDTISQELIDARKAAVDKLNQAHPDLNLTLVQDLQNVVKEAYDTTEDELADTDGVEAAAADAGIRVSDAFVDSFLSRIPALVPKMSKELQEVLGKIGGGAQLSRQGALSFGAFLQGFGDADFGVLEETSGIVEEFLQSLVDTGQIDEVDVPRLLFGAREDLAQGVKDIQEVGAVTQSTMQRIRASAGGASKFVLQLLDSYAPLAAATDAAKAAQEQLNSVTERYKAILTPLRKELEAINEANQLADEEEKILSLRRLIANQAVSDRRRTNAQLQINQILAERRVRGLENERDAAVEGAEEELKAREKTRDALEQQFSDLQRNIQAQLTQLGLFSQEASIIRKLQEEAAKLREKEMTDQELQLKFLELQGEELADLIEAARAKHTLEDASSTELEKQQAQIKLAEIALRRRNREAEAIKLGIPVEELTKLRDFVVTLDDIGVKSKEAFEFEGTGGLGDSIVDANKLTEQWEQTLTDVKTRWQEIKDNIRATATEINNNLPSFLKIFPEEAGGEPPIIGFLKSYTGAIVGLIIAINTFKVITTLAGLVTAIRNLMTVGSIGGAAAGGAAAAGGGSAAIAAITTSIVTLGGAALVAAGYLVALKSALDAFGTSQEQAFEENTKQISTALGDFGPALTEETNKLIGNVDVTSEEAKRNLADNITSAAISAIQDGFGDEHVAASIGNAVNRSIAEGLIADTPENKAAIASFQTNLLSILQGTAVGEVPKINLLTGATLEATPTEQQVADVKKSVGTFLSGITDEEQKSAFALNMESLIRDAVTLGMTNAQIDTLVFGAFNEGVKAGLVSDTEENRVAISSYIDGIIATMQSEAEIKSPSGLAEREIGVPLGQGILKGIGTALSQGSKQLVSISDIMWGDLETSFDKGRDNLVAIAEALRVSLNTKFTAIKTTLKILLDSIVLQQNTGWTQVRTDSERETEALRVSTGIKFESIRSALFTKMAEIKAVVVDAFKAMRVESETEISELRKTVVNLLAGTEGSLLTDLNAAFLGLDQAVPKNIGRLFIEGIALGITENRQTLADAMVDALQFALLTTAQTELAIKSPSQVAAKQIGLPYVQGIAQGILDGIGLVGNASRLATAAAIQAPLEARYGGSRPGAVNAATTSNVTRNNHYHLNVRSSAQSQGIISDFGIMQTMRSR